MTSNLVDVLMEKAIELADRPYRIEEYEDILSNGKKIVFLKHPELRGCMAQGSTIEEAKEELREARISYIHSLLINNQEAPEPTGGAGDGEISTATSTAGSQVSYATGKENKNTGITWGTFETVIEKVIQPDHRKLVARHRAT